MNEPKVVGIGQIVVSRAPEQICCLGLGSCVAVFLYDPEAKIGGVLHILLPKAPPHCQAQDKYADTGIIKLLQLVLARGARKERLVAKLVGGAQMFQNLNISICDIGADNCHQAKKILRDMGIRTIAEDIEGKRGRSATFHLDSGKVAITTAFSGEHTI
jgi:chemotaxis protein CheD